MSHKRKANHAGVHGSESEDVSPIKVARIEEGQGDHSLSSWSSDECKALLSALTPDNRHRTSDFHKIVKQINWSQISINDHGSEDCKRMLLIMLKCVRKYRTITEILTDCQAMLETRMLEKILLPKRPPNLFMVFYKKNVAQIKAEHPSNLNITELSKIVSEKFHKMSDKRKIKMEDQHEVEMKVYRATLEQFKSAHPEIYAKVSKKGKPTFKTEPAAMPVQSDIDSDAEAEPEPEREAEDDLVEAAIIPLPKTPSKKKSAGAKVDDTISKPLIPKQIYLNTQVDGKLEKHPQKSREKLEQKYAKKWTKLSEEGREPWIVMAVDDKIRFRDDVTTRRDDGIISQQTSVVLLAKAKFSRPEAQLKLQDMGKPKSSPLNGYQWYLASRWAAVAEKIKAGELPKHTFKANSEFLGSIARDWKNLSEVQKEKYKDKCKKDQRSYEENYKRWRHGLSALDSVLVAELELLVMSRKKTAKTSTAAAPKTPKTPQKAASRTPQKVVSNMPVNGQNKKASKVTAKKQPVASLTETHRTIVEHFSPKPATKTLTKSDSSSSDDSPSIEPVNSPVKSPKKEKTEEVVSDSGSSVSSGSSGSRGSSSSVDSLSDDFQSPKKAPMTFRPSGPVLSSTPAQSGAKNLANLKLASPPLISPMVSGSPKKKFR